MRKIKTCILSGTCWTLPTFKNIQVQISQDSIRSFITPWSQKVHFWSASFTRWMNASGLSSCGCFMLASKRIVGVTESSRRCTRSLGEWRKVAAARWTHSSHRKPRCSSYTVSGDRETGLYITHHDRNISLTLSSRWITHLTW